MTCRGLFVGLTTMDLIQRVDHHPGVNEKVVAQRSDLAAGGPAAIAAVTFSALGGRSVLLSSKPGGDKAPQAAAAGAPAVTPKRRGGRSLPPQ
jgi:sugar/nucleoside kinase (ribokinase family)